MFYTIFLLYYFTEFFLQVLCFWAAAIIAAMIFRVNFGASAPAAVLSILLSPLNLEFLFGIGTALIIREKLFPPCLQLLAILSAIIAITFLTRVQDFRVLFGFAMAAATVSLVRLEAIGKLRSAPVLVSLGNASYAIYLVHDPLVSIVVRLTANDQWPTVVLTCVLVGVGGGLAYHFLFEKPAIAFAKSVLVLRNR